MTGVLSLIRDGKVKRIEVPQGEGSDSPISIVFSDDTTLLMLREDAAALRDMIARSLSNEQHAHTIPVDIEYRDLKLTVFVERGMVQLPYGGARPDGSVTVVSVLDDRSMEVMPLIEALDPNAIIKFEEEASEYIEGKRQMKEEEKWEEEHGK